MIEAYAFGRMRVGGEDHAKDLIVFAPASPDARERVLGGWWRREGHALHPADLDAVDEARPAVLVVGCGAYGRMRVPEETLAWLRERGVEPEVCATTPEAVDRYNALLAEGRRVAGAFHLTC